MNELPKQGLWGFKMRRIIFGPRTMYMFCKSMCKIGQVRTGGSQKMADLAWALHSTAFQFQTVNAIRGSTRYLRKFEFEFELVKPYGYHEIFLDSIPKLAANTIYHDCRGDILKIHDDIQFPSPKPNTSPGH
jgi:hypothetical protein